MGTLDTEEIDRTIDITVKQNNSMMKYELKPLDIKEIGKSIKRIQSRLVQAEKNDPEVSNLDCMEAENSTSLDENSEVWEPTPNGQEALAYNGYHNRTRGQIMCGPEDKITHRGTKRKDGRE